MIAITSTNNQKIQGSKRIHSFNLLHQSLNQQSLFLAGKCGVLSINLTHGTQFDLSSYAYPSFTPIQLECTWTVQAPLDTRVQVSFHEFLLYGDDVFQVGNGLYPDDTGSILLIRKGSVTPLYVRATENQMWIRFSTDGREEGFRDVTLFLVELSVYEKGTKNV